MSRESDMGGRRQHASVKMDPAGGRANHITLTFVLCAVPLLLANWFIVAMVIGRDCVVLYAGGNITECGGGLILDVVEGRIMFVEVLYYPKLSPSVS